MWPHIVGMNCHLFSIPDRIAITKIQGHVMRISRKRSRLKVRRGKHVKHGAIRQKRRFSEECDQWRIGVFTRILWAEPWLREIHADST
jgi:hypothetical protein